MNPIRLTARILTGSTYVVLGLDAALTPAGRVDQAAPLISTMRKKSIPLPADDETLVRINGAVQAVAGAMLAFGRLPRLSALALIGSLVPTTAAGHAFWAVEDPAKAKAQRVQFQKNMAMIGGLAFAVLDKPRRRATESSEKLTP